MLTLKMKKTVVLVTFILISGRFGEPLTSSNATSNHFDVTCRPTSQRRLHQCSTILLCRQNTSSVDALSNDSSNDMYAFHSPVLFYLLVSVPVRIIRGLQFTDNETDS